ncbi:MAG: hypothetical protein AAFY65_13750 [Pseudomonadota bacterium]
MTGRAIALLLPVLCAGCNLGEGGGGVTTTVENAAVEPGHASCLAAIGRADVALDPTADMSTEEIDAFVRCIGERASG